MKNIDDQLNEIMKRSEILKNKEKNRNYIIGYAIAGAVCVSLMILVAVSIGNINTATGINEPSGYGSLIISAPYMGYVLIGLLSFILGILATLMCMKMKKCKNDNTS